MSMTKEGTGIWYSCFFESWLSFISSQHFNCRCCCQPSVLSERVMESSASWTDAENLSDQSGRCWLLGWLLQCMPTRGSRTTFLLLELVPTSTVSHERSAWWERWPATSSASLASFTSANVTSSKCRAALAKMELLKLSSLKRPMRLRALSLRYWSTSSARFNTWSRSTCRFTHFTICCQPLPCHASYSNTAPSMKSFIVGNPVMPNVSPESL
mmetsp:Transcript_88068/g.247574  ORF Transcript_88068/g.247574 Transcript_88068/m.247574 type:complete len:213 (-) Transcript_88068:388-1026(-)